MFVNPMAAARTIGTDISAGRYLRKNSGRSRFVAVVMTTTMSRQTTNEMARATKVCFQEKRLFRMNYPLMLRIFLVFVAVVFAIYSVNHGIWVA